jgi:hypothetical protein
MFPSVLAAFAPFNKTFEGYLPWMYVDRLNLVTTGMGNLIDPKENALRLPWRRPDGSLASAQEISDAWTKVKNSGAAGKGGGNQGHLTTLRLNEEGIKQVINSKVTENERILKTRIPRWDTLPADAQLAVHSMAWAMGPNFKYPKFIAALNQTIPDFDTAIKQSYIPDNPQKSLEYPPADKALRDRNVANRALLIGAKKVVEEGLPIDLFSTPIDRIVDIAKSGIQFFTSGSQKVAQAVSDAATDAAKASSPVVATIAVLGVAGCAVAAVQEAKKRD